jgi:hypothetical protein
MAITALEMDATPEYSVDDDNLEISSDDIYGIVAILHDNGIYSFKVFGLEMNDVEPDQFRTDAEADADALRSAGFDDEENYCPSIDSFGEDE